MTTKGILLDLGLREYGEVLELQHKIVELRANKTISDTLILVEHPHVFTVGKAVPGEIPAQINAVPIFRIERGGRWTYHGPGQLLGYPILDLNVRQRDIHDFLRRIEETLILTLATFDLSAERYETGIWVKKKKIASIGAAIRNWISFHGFALNVNTDLRYFEMITPCGMPGSTMTSMQTLLGEKLDFERVKNEVRTRFEDIFDLEFVSAKSETLVSNSVT